MGTYRQPGLVLDKSLGIIPEEIGKFQDQLMQSMKDNRAAKMKAEQENLKRDIKRKAAEAKREKEDLKYKSQIAQIGNVVDGQNQIAENGKISVKSIKTNKYGKASVTQLLDVNSEYYIGDGTLTDDQLTQVAVDMVGEGGIEPSMKIDLEHAVEQMSLYPMGSKERIEWRNQADQMIKEIPVLTTVFNNEAESHRPAYKFDGTALPMQAGIENRLLMDGQPQWELRKQMESDIVFSSNPNRFTTIPPAESPDGTSMVRYNNGTESINISFKRYQELSEKGGSIMGLTKAKPFNEMIKSVWESRVKSHYGGVSKYSSENEKNGTSSVTKRQTIKSFDAANEVMKKEVALWIDSGGLLSKKGNIPGYNYAQNSWQMMGGPNDDPLNNIYTGTPEQKERAKGLMVDSMKLAYGSETSISNYGITETQLKEQKLTKIQSAARIVALEDGITLYPRGDGDDKTQQEANQKVKLKAINIALGKPEGNKKIDLEDIKTHWTELSKKPTTLAALLNSMSSSPDANNKLYYQGDTIAEELAIQLHGDKDVPLEAKVLDAFYVKGVGGWEAKDFLNGYDAFEMDILNALSKSKEYENIKKANLKKTSLEDVKVVEVVLPKSTEDEDRNFYRSQTT
tara:strand:+ start:12064 stop:13941 length:1878 start_codon:yes stop_codon:yes gene_type:complete